jgi:antirestriction protein ArdC
MTRDLYASVTARILAELEAGSAPWIKPWSATAGANTPCNAISNRPYSGCNVVLLWMAASAGYPLPRFLTYKQAQEAGGNVRKGEHGFKVYFVKQLAIRNEDASDDDEARIATMLREYTVFNVSQCDGLREKVMRGPESPKVRNRDARDTLADEFLASSRADIREGFGEAYYRPSDDYVSLPPFHSFKGADHFYNTAFHELGHWTGHRSRLDRDLKNRFGDRQYAAEELVAELAAAFLCAEFGFDNDLRHAGYIASWIELLRHDKKAIFTAASRAQAAADYLRRLALADPVPALAEAA